MKDFTFSEKKVDIVDVIFGENCTIMTPSNIYGCSLGDNCFIGPFVEIQKDVVIGDNVRIQSHSFICELVSIGKDCFVGHGVMFINDTFQNGKINTDSKYWKITSVGNNVLIGSNSTILPVNICDDVIIGAGSVVTKNIIESGVYVGNPAKKIREI